MWKKRKCLTDIEIKEEFKHGFVELSPMIENLIEKFNNDKTSLDIQQLQLITTYLIIERELDKDFIDELDTLTEKQENIITNACYIIKKSNKHFKDLSDDKLKEYLYNFDKCAEIN